MTKVKLRNNLLEKQEKLNIFSKYFGLVFFIPVFGLSKT